MTTHAHKPENPTETVDLRTLPRFQGIGPLLTIRQILNLSQNQFCERTGIGRTALSQAEARGHIPARLEYPQWKALETLVREALAQAPDHQGSPELRLATQKAGLDV